MITTKVRSGRRWRNPDPTEREWAGEELAWWVPQARRGLEAIGVA